MLISNPRFEPRRNDSALPRHVAAAAVSSDLGTTNPMPGASLGAMIGIIRESFWLILLCGLAMGALGFAAGKLLPSYFTAEGLMVMDTQLLNIPDFQTVRSERTVEPWGGRSEAQVITSRATVAQAVKALELDRHPAFNAPSHPSVIEWLAAVEWLPDNVRVFLHRLSPLELATPEFSTAEVVEIVRRNLKVQSEERSYAIQLSYTDTDPVLATNIVNTIMDVYVAEQIAAKRDTTLAASRDMRNKVDQLGKELQTVREKIRELEAETFVVESGDGTVSAQNLVALNQERRTLEVERAELLSDRQQIAEAIASGRTSVLNASIVPPRLRAIWEAQAELQRNIADGATQFGPQHPRMIALRSELSGLIQEAEREVEGLLRDLDRRLASTDERAASLDAQIRNAEAKAGSSARGRASLKQLESEATSLESLYNLYRERYELTLASLDSFRSDVRLVSRAEPPPRPSSPSATLLAAIGGIIGVTLAGIAVVARRHLQDGIESVEEAVEVTGHPALGSVPAVRGTLLGRPSLPANVATDRSGVAAETLRGIILRMQAPGADGVLPKVLMFTSSVPGDGKSSVVAAAARIAANEGLRCLALDADFRKGSMASLLQLKGTGATLNDYLNGRADLLDALVRDDQSSAHFLFTRPMRVSNLRFLNHPRMEYIFAWARSEYDLVLVDTPPVMRVIDPLILSQYSDATVMVVSWRSVKRQTVRAAIKRLEDVGAPILGVVLTRLGNSASDDLYYSGYGKNR